MGEWQRVRLGELIEIKHGFAFKGEFFHHEPPGDFLLTPGNFAIGGGFQWGKRKYYRDGPVPDDSILCPGDILVTMTDLSKEADTLGYSAVVPDSPMRLLHNQRLGKVIVKSDEVATNYVHWLMRSPDYRNEILASYTGSTVKHTSPKKILAYQFDLPPLDEQAAIAGILDAIDDTIDLNRRMNETLEAMAWAIFKDWFVEFGPTRAKDEGRAPYLAPKLWELFPDGFNDDGVPAQWRFRTVGECFHLTMGQSPPGSTYNDDGEGLPFFQGRTDFRFRYPKNRRYCTIPTRIANCDDTLVSVRAPVGDINMAWEKCCAGRGVAAFRHKSRARSFTYYSARAIQQDLKQYEQTGTVFGAINKKQFEAINVLDPTPKLVGLFECYVEPLDDRIRRNVAESETLAQTRDLLLPKLVSGEIRVPEVEGVMKAVA